MRQHRSIASLDMTEGTIWPILLQFTIPLLLGNLFQLLYNTVDSMVVGNFVGQPALAAVSATTQICNTLVKFFSLRAVGDTRRPLFFLLVCSGLNVVLDLLFVAVLPWGIAGAAAVTVVSQMISAVLVLWALTFQMDDCRLHWSSLRIDRRTTGQILKIGLPVGFQQAVIAFSNVFVQAYFGMVSQPFFLSGKVLVELLEIT